ncbi:hypothetical protein C0J52_27978 [Blattella germanica]|nr:hypothetical protein C0J52_27978 [Blattella germanica]
MNIGKLSTGVSNILSKYRRLNARFICFIPVNSACAQDISFATHFSAGVAQVASEGMDDTRMDLTQLEESGTGRSVPTTPLQVSPQGEFSFCLHHCLAVISQSL